MFIATVVLVNVYKMFCYFISRFFLYHIYMSDSKQKIINDVYYDRAGFGSLKKTLDEARKKDSSIRMDDVKQFFSKNVEERRRPRGQNSFVAPHSFFEFQLDLFFISKNDLENFQKFRIGLVLIDIFTKYAVVIPIKSKSPSDLLAGIMEGIQKMGRKPKMLYSDEESGLRSADVMGYLEKENIEIHHTRSHPAFAERFIRTYKDMLFKRVEFDQKKEKPNIQWIDYNAEILLTYNTKNVHSTTGLTPKQAREPKNEIKTKLNISIKATKTRKYPNLDIGDSVKVMRKKGITEKEKTSHWLKEIKTVKKIETKLGQKYYFLDNDTVGYLRHELLKV